MIINPTFGQSEHEITLPFCGYRVNDLSFHYRCFSEHGYYEIEVLRQVNGINLFWIEHKDKSPEGLAKSFIENGVIDTPLIMLDYQDFLAELKIANVLVLDLIQHFQPVSHDSRGTRQSTH